jgi:tryptophan synthase alpha chain
MNRIDRLFETGKKNILSIYFTAGFPHLNDTVEIIKTPGLRGR